MEHTDVSQNQVYLFGGLGFWAQGLGFLGFRVSQNEGYLFGGPCTKDCSILRLYWGPLI